MKSLFAHDPDPPEPEPEPEWNGEGLARNNFPNWPDDDMWYEDIDQDQLAEDNAIYEHMRGMELKR